MTVLLLALPMTTPASPSLPLITFRSAAAGPPTVTPVAPKWTYTPPRVPLPASAVPSAVRPTQLPATVLLLPLTSIPASPNRLMTSPRTVLLAALIVRPATPAPAESPRTSTTGAPTQPGCVVPSMTIVWVTVGRAEV